VTKCTCDGPRKQGRVKTDHEKRGKKGMKCTCDELQKKGHGKSMKTRVCVLNRSKGHVMEHEKTGHHESMKMGDVVND